MSNIANHLRALASATRVSMEADVDPAVQGQEDSLDKELAAVAAKAAEEEEQNTDTTSPDTDAVPANTEVPAEETAPVEGAEAEASADALDPPAAAGDESSTADEPKADEIETPAETDLKAEMTEQAQQEAETEAAAVDAEDQGAEGSSEEQSEVNADVPSSDSDGEQTDTSVDPEVNTDADINAEVEVPAEGDSLPIEGEVAPAEVVTSDEVPADEVPVTTEDAPAPVEAAAPPQPVEAPEKPAVVPGPQSDTSEAVQEVVELTEALAAAQSAEDVVKKAHEVSSGLQDTAGVAEVMNEQGGVSVEAFCLIETALRPHLAQLGYRSINLGVTLESYSADPKAKFQLSLEELHDIIADLEHAEPILERQPIESLERTVCALKDAIPSACERLKAVISKASLADDNSYGHSPVDVSDGLAAALYFDRSSPENLADDLQVYAQLGRQLLGEYSEKAFNGAKAASLINNAVNFSSDSGFWEKIKAAVDAVQDPRAVLGESNLLMSLPGGSHLFGERGRGFSSGNETLLKLVAYTDDYAPMQATVAGKADASVSTFPGFTASKIQLVGRALEEVLDCDHICKRLDEGQKLWPEAVDVIRHLRESFENAPGSLDYNTTQHFPQIVKFVETSYSLATWPLINYLANFILTVNAFVLFAERSLTAPAARAQNEVEATATEGDVTSTPAEEPVVETPPVEGEGDTLSEPPVVDEPKI
mgnify:CR=1 FL=1